MTDNGIGSRRYNPVMAFRLDPHHRRQKSVLPEGPVADQHADDDTRAANRLQPHWHRRPSEPDSVETYEDKPAHKQDRHGGHDDLIPERLILLDEGFHPFFKQGRIILGHHPRDKEHCAEKQDHKRPSGRPPESSGGTEKKNCED